MHGVPQYIVPEGQATFWAMKTILYSPCWLAPETDQQGNDRLARTQRYLQYYREIQPILGFDRFHFSDNASPLEELKKITATDIEIYRFFDELRRGPNCDEYPYAWRGFYHLEYLMAQGWEKIILIDTDSFVLSRRMADFIRETNTGYYSFHAPSIGYAATEISVICQDAYAVLKEWMKIPWQVRSNQFKRIETELPFTHVYHQFVGDRYGFDGNDKQRPDMDFYCQARLTTELKFQI